PGVTDEPQISQERRLTPEIRSPLAAQEKIEAVGVARSVVAGDAVDRQTQEGPANIDRDFIDVVQTVQALVIVRIHPEIAARRKVADRAVDAGGCRETLSVL